MGACAGANYQSEPAKSKVRGCPQIGPVRVRPNGRPGPARSRTGVNWGHRSCPVCRLRQNYGNLLISGGPKNTTRQTAGLLSFCSFWVSNPSPHDPTAIGLPTKLQAHLESSRCLAYNIDSCNSMCILPKWPRGDHRRDWGSVEALIIMHSPPPHSALWNSFGIFFAFGPVGSRARPWRGSGVYDSAQEGGLGSRAQPGRGVWGLRSDPVDPCPGLMQLLRDTTDEAQTSVTAAQLTEMTLFNRGNCGLKDSQPPTGGVGPVGALLGA